MDTECDLNLVKDLPRETKVRNVLITAADPYGQNSAIIIGEN